jgi:hypothetical protein
MRSARCCAEGLPDAAAASVSSAAVSIQRIGKRFMRGGVSLQRDFSILVIVDATTNPPRR